MKDDLLVACEHSCLLFTPTATWETREEMSAIRGQKFHTDDVVAEKIAKSSLLHKLAYRF